MVCLRGARSCFSWDYAIMCWTQDWRVSMGGSLDVRALGEVLVYTVGWADGT